MYEIIIEKQEKNKKIPIVFVLKNTDFRQRFLLFECFYALLFDDDSILRLAS